MLMWWSVALLWWVELLLTSLSTVFALLWISLLSSLSERFLCQPLLYLRAASTMFELEFKPLVRTCKNLQPSQSVAAGNVDTFVVYSLC